MRIPEAVRSRRLGIALVLALAGAGATVALDPPVARSGAAERVIGDYAVRPRRTDARAREIVRDAVRAERKGDATEAARLFAAAAARAHVPAEWKFARMLERGEGVEPDARAALAYHRRIADRYADTDPDLALVPFVADATRETGRAFLDGEAGGIARDLHVARRYLRRAANLYADAEAQFLLARTWSTDEGADPRRAAGWLARAADRGHVLARATLGEMMVRGGGVAIDPVPGLAMMAQAVEDAPPHLRATLALQFQTVLTEADEDVRETALAQLRALHLSAALQPVMAASN